MNTRPAPAAATTSGATVTMPGATGSAMFDPASIALAGVILAVGLLTSFTHVRDVAHAHGWSGPTSWAPPVITELLAAASGVNIRWRLKARIKNLAFPITGLLLGLTLSLGANEATATDGIGPQFARLPWGSILAVLMPGSAFLVLMMIEPMFTRSHADRATATEHAHVVDILTVVRDQLALITTDVHARMDAHTGALTEAMHAHGQDITAAVRARLDEAVRGLGVQSHELETEITERLDEVDERTHKRAAELVRQVREHLDQVAEQGRRNGADLVAAARDQGCDLAEQALKAAQQIADQARADGEIVAASTRQATAELSEQVRELTAYTELADLADDQRAERSSAEHRELAAHVESLAAAAHARLTGLRTEGRAQPSVHARTAMRAVTSGAPRTPSVHTDAESRIAPEEFVRELVRIMRTEPAWTPDYTELERRTGYRKRWLQLRVAEAREHLTGGTDDEIADAEIVEEPAA